ncbi:MAG: hypothetical protein K6G03_02330 [Lachnospiraceae bacterium]|nr:hypothetical protein [Lachnospiraceae bacterium]
MNGNIYDIRDSIEEFVSHYEALIKGALRFLLAFITLSVVNGKLGYMDRLNSAGIVFAVSLLCALLPPGVIIFFAAVFTVLHCYALSIEAAFIMIVVFLLMFLLYFRFTPKDTLAVLLTPLSFVFRIPYVMPIVYGLKGSPLSALSVGFGTAAYFIIDYIADSESVIKGMAEATTVERFRTILDGVLKNPEMIAYIIAFAFTVVVVNIIKRLSFKNSWTVAICAGAAVNIILLMILSLRLNADINIGALILGSVIAIIIAFIYKLFVFSVDYAKTERLQFEDDGYVYYVKAVPKIKSHRRRRGSAPRPRDDD